MYNLNPKTRKEHLMGKIAGNPNAEEITDLKTREEHFLKDIEEASGGGSEPFVVTLTPTASDFSGTMDKTVGEIYEAYLAGKRIIFKVDISVLGTPGFYYVECTTQYTQEGYTYPTFNVYIITGNDMLISAWTGYTSDPYKASYGTYIYTLTRA